MTSMSVAQQRAGSNPTRDQISMYREVLDTFSSSDVTVIVNPLDTAEMYVTPTATMVVDLPTVLPLLPLPWQSARVHRFEPSIGRFGTWVLRRDVPSTHIFGDRCCSCSACESWRSVRVALIVQAVSA